MGNKIQKILKKLSVLNVYVKGTTMANHISGFKLVSVDKIDPDTYIENVTSGKNK